MLAPLLISILAAAAIRHDQTPLRGGCDPSAGSIATLDKGTPVEIRFALADGGDTCYKVAVVVDGSSVVGYVRSNQLDTSTFDRGRQNAAILTESIKVSVAAKVAAGGNRQLAASAALIQANRPAEALAQLEPIARVLREPNVLVLTGLAAWKSDDPRKALEYWRSALEMVRDPELERLCKQVEREIAHDRSSEKSYGMKVLLRFERDTVSPDLARAMAEALDQEYDRISGQLGCAWHERLIAVVQSRDAYLKTTAAAEWSGGQFDGRIRVALLEDSRVGPLTRRAFSHELTHACLANLGSWPAWLHEGLAQKLSGELIAPATRARIGQLASARALPRLDEIAQNWSRMSPENAAIAYGLSLTAIETLFERFGNYGLRNILSNAALLRQITAELDGALGLGRK